MNANGAMKLKPDECFRCEFEQRQFSTFLTAWPKAAALGPGANQERHTAASSAHDARKRPSGDQRTQLTGTLIWWVKVARSMSFSSRSSTFASAPGTFQILILKSKIDLRQHLLINFATAEK